MGVPGSGSTPFSMKSEWDNGTKWYSGGNTANDPDAAKKAADAKTKTPSGGTYSSSMSLALIFWNEMRRMDSLSNPVAFEGGNVTDVLGGGKYKVKLMGSGSVVTATSTMEAGAALFPWQKSKSNILKGALVLMIANLNRSITPSSMTVPPTYSIISVRQTGVFAPKEASEYTV